MKEAMKSVIQPDATQWTIVYDKEKKTLEFYWKQNFEKGHSFGF